MASATSPAVIVNEYDVTTTVPTVSSTQGAIAGPFLWGPLNVRYLVDSENTLATVFGQPSNFNAETWFTAANFLSYTSGLYVTRVANTTSTNSAIAAYNAFANVGTVSNIVTQVTRNSDDFNAKKGTYDTNILYLARYPGSMGNSLRISVCDSPTAYSSNIAVSNSTVTGTVTVTAGSNTGVASFVFGGGGSVVDANTMATTFISSLSVGDLIKIGNNTVGTQYLKLNSISATPTTNTTVSTVNMTFTSPNRTVYDYSSNTSVSRYWEFFSLVGVAPGTSTYQSTYGNTAAVDELHVVVVDNNGVFSGSPGAILETYQSLSRATDSQSINNISTYYTNYINTNSKYIRVVNDRSNATSNVSSLLSSSTNIAPLSLTFNSGSDGSNEANISIGVMASGYDLYASKTDVDVSLILAGKARGVNYTQLGNYIIDNICEVRKDCIVFISPNYESVVNNQGFERDSLLTFFNNSRVTTYGFLDSGYKYQYDKYNDVNRWIPLNGDIAGLAARTDYTNDPWWAFAGLNRGQIKNLIRLAYNPKQSDRDVLYPSAINPVVTIPGQGTFLYGNHTMTTKPSLFSRMNIRRLFIVLEKAISQMAQYTVFEFNDEFTRAQFRNIINPYLRDIQGRRGVNDFVVICDQTNNTPQVIDQYRFVADIYIKPEVAAEDIYLNFVGVNNSVSFSEVIGKYI